MTTKDPEIAVLYNETEAEGPFHALEFFEIEKSTLTTLTSIIFTYLLVMAQFNDSFYPQTLVQKTTNVGNYTLP